MFQAEEKDTEPTAVHLPTTTTPGMIEINGKQEERIDPDTDYFEALEKRRRALSVANARANGIIAPLPIASGQD